MPILLRMTTAFLLAPTDVARSFCLDSSTSYALSLHYVLYINRVGQTIHTYVYTVFIRYFWQGIYHTYGHIRCAFTVLANPIYK